MLKFLSLLAGFSVLTTTIAPLAVKAEPTTPMRQQMSDQQVKGRPGKAALNLTESQKAQMSQMRQETRAQMEAVLTPEQRQQLQTARNSRDRWAPLANLNLSEQQKNQIQEIRQSAKSRMEAILTPQQREQMQQLRQSRREQRQQQN